jgi:nitrogen PTS system EIIA component
MHIPKPTVTLCFLEHEIDFNAVDGRPVRILFTIVSPVVRAHLHLLSRLGYALRDEHFRHLLSRQATRDDILSAVRRVDDLDLQRRRPE